MDPGEDIAISALADRIKGSGGGGGGGGRSGGGGGGNLDGKVSLTDSFEAMGKAEGGSGGGSGGGNGFVRLWRAHPRMRRATVTFVVVTILVVALSVYLRPHLLMKENQEDPADLVDPRAASTPRLDPIKVLAWSGGAGASAAVLGLFIGNKTT
jgi:hypothetical protein